MEAWKNAIADEIKNSVERVGYKKVILDQDRQYHIFEEEGMKVGPVVLDKIYSR
jgi:thiamine biosynthesis lipoprotein ApbE